MFLIRRKTRFIIKMNGIRLLSLYTYCVVNAKIRLCISRTRFLERSLYNIIDD